MCMRIPSYTRGMPDGGTDVVARSQKLAWRGLVYLVIGTLAMFLFRPTGGLLIAGMGELIIVIAMFYFAAVEVRHADR